MIYKILVKNDLGTMTYVTQKVEIMEQVVVNGEIVEQGTGKFKNVDFETKDVNEVKEKYIELLDQYKKDKIDVVCDMKEIVTITVDIQDADENTEKNEDNIPEGEEPESEPEQTE